MDYATALGKIEGIDDGVEVLNAVKARVAGVLEEKKAAVKKQQSLQAVVDLLGADGDTVEAKVTAATEKIKELQGDVKKGVTELEASQAKVTALEAEKLEATKKVGALERSQLITEMSAAGGLNTTVLTRLLGDSPLAKSDKGEGVEKFLVGEGDKAQTITKLLETDDWKPFAAALKPQEMGTGGGGGKLNLKPPKAGTTDPNEKSKPIVRYTGAKALFGDSAN